MPFEDDKPKAAQNTDFEAGSDNAPMARESRKTERQFYRKRQMRYISSLMHLPFSEDKRQKLPPPQRSVKNGLFVLLSLHISRADGWGWQGEQLQAPLAVFSQIF